MKYFIAWETAGCDGECGTVSDSDSELWDSAGQC